MQSDITSSDTAAAGCAERNDLLAAEIIAFQEGLDDSGRYAPPDWETYDYRVIGCHIEIVSCDLGPC